MTAVSFLRKCALAALVTAGTAQAWDKAYCTDMLAGIWDYSSLRTTGTDSGTVATIALEPSGKATASLDNVEGKVVTRVSMLEGTWSAEAGSNNWACTLILAVGGNPPNTQHLEIVSANEFMIGTARYWRVQNK
ncbi:hypothetical protein sos41_08870 [Alphaproteobacteria bacterium SO-S41]|nr:hypothetical protein sos41_08870 [Alphaproteobacteria bacterium SO-S41]